MLLISKNAQRGNWIHQFILPICSTWETLRVAFCDAFFISPVLPKNLQAVQVET